MRATPEQVQEARDLYQRDGEIEIDDNAPVEEGDKNDYWIQAWVYMEPK